LTLHARNRCEKIKAALKSELNLPDTSPIEFIGALFEPPEPRPLEDVLAAALPIRPVIRPLFNPSRHS
jgi:hypothetical protein